MFSRTTRPSPMTLVAKAGWLLGQHIIGSVLMLPKLTCMGPARQLTPAEHSTSAARATLSSPGTTPAVTALASSKMLHPRVSHWPAGMAVWKQVTTFPPLTT